MKASRLFILVTLFLCACVHQPEIRPAAVESQPLKSQRIPANGSIWNGSGSGIAEDFKARALGDTLTIVITETASASKEATTGTSRTSSVGAGIPNLFGLETGRIKNWMDLNNLITASNSSKFDGSGTTTRKENLNATITASVVGVLPNGNLLIEGRRNVMVNNEDQIIVLTGSVRPRDISTDNYVNSTLVADAKITYSGKGVVSDQQRPGWLMTLMNILWPF